MSLSTKAVLTFWNGRVLFLGHSIDTTPHQHYAIQVTVGLERPFRLLSNGEWRDYRTAVIDSNHPHQLGGEGWQAVLLLDPQLEYAQNLVPKSPVESIDFASVAPIAERLANRDFDAGSCEELGAICDQLVKEVGMASRETAVSPPNPDPRIQEALQFMSQQPLKKVSTAAIANAVYLSESRLTHLFKEQMQIPIRRYLLWLRLLDAVENITTGNPITTAAHEAGFADSAHLSRTFRHMFGLTPSELFKNSQFVQVNTCLF